VKFPPTTIVPPSVSDDAAIVIVLEKVCVAEPPTYAPCPSRSEKAFVTVNPDVPPFNTPLSMAKVATVPVPERVKVAVP
jgi:hypothetical protein